MVRAEDGGETAQVSAGPGRSALSAPHPLPGSAAFHAAAPSPGAPPRPGIPARCSLRAPGSRPGAAPPLTAALGLLPPRRPRLSLPTSLPSPTPSQVSLLPGFCAPPRVQIPPLPWQLLSPLCFRSGRLCCSLPGQLSLSVKTALSPQSLSVLVIFLLVE